MRNTRPPLRPHRPATYRIKVQGRLDEGWSAWFDNMAITVESGDDRATVTTLTGVVIDQPALHGLLARVRDLGLPLLLVERLARGDDVNPPIQNRCRSTLAGMDGDGPDEPYNS